ncbi:MAG: hypothetical protein DWI57_05350, partial [Chloroflexi bacterium]
MKRLFRPTRTIGIALLLAVLTVVLPGAAWAATCTSTSSGTWGGTNTATWSCGTPAATDDIVIASGHTITLGADKTTAALTIQSGGTLVGANGFDLLVTGNWSNSGTFTHNNSIVTLDAPSGTQTVSGSTVFDKLTLDASGATINFGSSVITIQDRLQHDAGTMQGGTSTFTFENGTFIGGSNLKPFHHLIINGASVTNSSGEMRISGDLTVQSGKTLTFSGSRTASFNGSSLQTVTLNGTGIARFDTLSVESSAIVRLPAAADSQFSAETFTNNGALQQVKTSVSGATTFLTIKNQSAVAVYRGLDVTPGSGTPNITVSIAGNKSVCNNPNGGSYRNRCFRLESSAAAANSSVTLYTTTDEDDINNDAFYQYIAGVWTNKGSCSDTDGSSCMKTVDLAAGDNYFLIGDSTSAPTPVVLTEFGATAREDEVDVYWQTAVEIDFAGFYVWRSIQPSDPFEKVSPFIIATGGSVTGASYRFVDDNAHDPGSYTYRLQAVDLDNSSEFFAPTVTALINEPG